MIKYLLPLLVIFTITMYSQDSLQYNTIELDSVNNEPMLVGYCTREAFNDTAFSWFGEEYNNYQPDQEVIGLLEGKMDDVKVVIIFGSWCSDSKPMVPAFYKILDELNYPYNTITLIAVNRDKQGLDDELNGLNVELVPTIIFYREGSEIGRIVEVPNETIEKDMLDIL